MNFPGHSRKLRLLPTRREKPPEPPSGDKAPPKAPRSVRALEDPNPLQPLPTREPADDHGPSRPASEKSPSDRSGMDRPAKAGRRLARYAAWGLGLVVIVGVAAFAYVQYGLKTPTSVAVERLVIATAELTPFREFAPVTGRLVPEETVYLDSVEGGRVTELHLEEGAVVEKGAPIVTLANSNLELQAIGRETQFTEQKISLARAEMDFDRSNLDFDRQLMEVKLQIELARSALERRLPAEKTGVPQAEIDRLQTELSFQEETLKRLTEARDRNRRKAEGNLEELRGSLANMERSVDLMRESLADLSITAPIAGQLTNLDVEIGEVVAPGARIGQVDVIGDYKIRAAIDEYYLGRLAIGQKGEAQLGGKTYAVTVQKVYPNVEDRQFEVDLLFDETAPEGLRQGQSLRVRIELSDLETTLTIPNGPYYEQTGGLWVFVVSPDGTMATKREVTLGRKNPERVEVLAGVTEGERVIVSSYEGLETSDAIELKKTRMSNEYA